MFFNNESNFGVISALHSFIQTKNDDLMFFYKIDDKINSHYLFFYYLLLVHFSTPKGKENQSSLRIFQQFFPYFCNYRFHVFCVG